MSITYRPHIKDASGNLQEVKIPISSVDKLNPTYYVEGAGLSAGVWSGTCSAISAYSTGLKIVYKIPTAGAINTTLNINSLGAKKCYCQGSVDLTERTSVNGIVMLVYDAALSSNEGGWNILGGGANVLPPYIYNLPVNASSLEVETSIPTADVADIYTRASSGQQVLICYSLSGSGMSISLISEPERLITQTYGDNLGWAFDVTYPNLFEQYVSIYHIVATNGTTTGTISKKTDMPVPGHGAGFLTSPDSTSECPLVWRNIEATDLPSHEHTVANISDFPTSMPASDVSPWAKGSYKPSYAFSEILSKPTTLAGYGITNGVKYGDVLMPTNPFGGKQLYINSVDNAMFSANKKWYVVATTHKKVVEGVTYPYKDETVTDVNINPYVDSPVVSTLDATSLFDGSYESTVTCASDEYIKIKILFNEAGTAIFTGYPYGNYYLSYYHTSTPDKAEVRTYNTFAAHTVGWKLAEFSNYIGTNAATNFIQACGDPSNYRRKCLEFIVYGHPDHSTAISQLEWQLMRPNLARDGATFTKFGEQKSYHAFKFGTPTADNVVINPNGNLTMTGDLTVNGSIIQSGANYVTHAEELHTENDYILLREGATSGLANGAYAGFEAYKYDGTNNGRLVFDNTGTARVGDVGSESPLTTRAEANTFSDEHIVIWDNETLGLKDGGAEISNAISVNDASTTIPTNHAVTDYAAPIVHNHNSAYAQLNHNHIITSKTFEGIYAAANNGNNSAFYVGQILPTDYNLVSHIKYQLEIDVPNQSSYVGLYVVDLFICKSSLTAFAVFNNYGSSSYRTIYYHNIYRATEAGVTAGYGHLFGIDLISTPNLTNASYARRVKLKLLETDNCTVELFDNATIYSNVSGTGSTNYSAVTQLNGASIGLQETGDIDSYYKLQAYSRMQSGSYGLFANCLFAEANDNKVYPFTTTGGTGTSKAVNSSTKFRIGKPVYGYITGTALAANGISGDYVYHAYHTVDLRYTGNITTTTFAQYSAVYLEVTIDNATKTYSPTSNLIVTELTAGNYYIYLGMLYSSSKYQMALAVENPLYYYDGTKLIKFEDVDIVAGTGVTIQRTGQTLTINSTVTAPIQSVSLTSGTGVGTLKLVVNGNVLEDNIAPNGLQEFMTIERLD